MQIYKGSDFMWIETLKNGKLRAVERYRDPFTAKDKKVSVMIPKDTASNRKKAAAALQIKIQERLLEKPNSKITWKDLADDFMSYKKERLKETSMIIYNRQKKNVDYIIGSDTLVNSITARFIISRLEADTIHTLQTKNECISFFKMVMYWGYKRDYVNDVSFLAKIEKYKDLTPTAQSERKLFLDSSEIELLLENLPDKRYHDLVLLLTLSGMRISEALALEYNDIDLKTREIHITKQYYSPLGKLGTPKRERSVRKIYIQDELLTLASELRSNAMINYLVTGCPLLFSYKDHYISYTSAYNYIRKHSPIERISPHIFRHTHVSIMAEKGLSLEAISRRIGDTGEVVEKIYFHVTKNMVLQDYYNIANIKMLN